jgi:hypothetical protein
MGTKDTIRITRRLDKWRASVVIETHVDLKKRAQLHPKILKVKQHSKAKVVAAVSQHADVLHGVFESETFFVVAGCAFQFQQS